MMSPMATNLLMKCIQYAWSTLKAVMLTMKAETMPTSTASIIRMGMEMSMAWMRGFTR